MSAALPWVDADFWIRDAEGNTVVAEGADNNAAYPCIVLAANTYPKLVAILRSLEWADDGSGASVCCGATVRAHEPGCALAALLAECEG